jgi:hypothetical protein
MSDEDFDAGDEMSDEDDEEEMVDIQEGNGEQPSIDTGLASMDDSQQKKDRRPKQLKPVQEVILEVDPKSGLSKLPEEATRGYGNSVACILQDTINEHNIRQKIKKSIAILLISKLHTRYQFPSPYNGQELMGNLVNIVALGNMSKPLSAWKTRLRAMIAAGGGFEEVHKHYPQISKDQFKTFQANEKKPTVTRLKKWGKNMREMNLGNHNLESWGYTRKEPV